MAFLNLLYDFETLETYFFGDTISEANQIIADKVELTWNHYIISSLNYVINGGKLLFPYTINYN